MCNTTGQRRKLGAFAGALLTGLTALISLMTGCHRFERVSGENCDGDCRGHAKVCRHPTMASLACDLDHLESHIERFGSIVVQHPSVWGQARLTKHREEFEQIMAQDLCKFEKTLQGALSRSDTAYFANSVALSMAASGPSAMNSRPIAAQNSLVNLVPITVPDANLPAKIELGGSPARLPNSLGFITMGTDGIMLEPSVILNQKARYLNHLQELRRINEGDDTADSPGYALNLIRVPVSVLPGSHTQEGYGGEITMTLKPHLSEELLPTTFRNLVMNDLLEIIGVPLTQFLNDDEQVANLKEEAAAIRTVMTFEGTPITRATASEKIQKGQLNPSQLSEVAKVINTSKRALVDKQLYAFNDKDIDMGNKVVSDRYGKKPQFRFAFSSSKLRQARRPFPPSQIIDVFGGVEAKNVAMHALEVLQRDPTNKCWIHYPDMQSFLREELAAAYRLLAEPINADLWTYCSPELVTAIHSRNIDFVRKQHTLFNDSLGAKASRSDHKPFASDSDVTANLAWAIIVESALLTEQLASDMKEAAAAKNCPCPQAGWQDYYLPSPSHEARAAFNRYVECRWPIIVFALDPVTDQQNIADTFSSRREMQLAMSMAFVSGQISAKRMMQYARRLELEAETIALNNTVTGFSHGNETFGWRFQPRFQTPDTDSNATVLVRDMLIGGPSRNTLLKQRRLEPGQRECTAVVIMPSFVPYATLETASTWFKLTNPKHKDMTSVDAIELSGKVRAIENCACKVGDSNCYRDGELERLLTRVKQLEARLPLQSTKVQIPYENTLGGFAMFNTGITDLAPELYGWYGAPGINIDSDTTLFLIGNHFSVHQTRIVAGGVNIPACRMEMLSRQVMRVTIPKGALRLDENTGAFADAVKLAGCAEPPLAAPFNGLPEAKSWRNSCATKFVQIHVATPYGVTSPILVPAEVVCPPGCIKPAPGDTAEPKKETCPNPECTSYSCPEKCKDDAAELAKRRQKFIDSQAAETTKNNDAVKAFKTLQESARLKLIEDTTRITEAYKQKAKEDIDQYIKEVEKRLQNQPGSKVSGQTSLRMPNCPYLDHLVETFAPNDSTPRLLSWENVLTTPVSVWRQSWDIGPLSFGPSATTSVRSIAHMEAEERFHS
jgi:hypothetical protein